jgi:hypothetical protein
MTEKLPAELSPQKIAAQDRSAPRRITGRLKAALDRMVWRGDKRADAAIAAGMVDHSLRVALKKPHVLAYYRGELATLRESERARSVHALVDVRDASDNAMARVAAAKELEKVTVEAATRPNGNATSPGIVIRILTAAPPLPTNPVIEVGIKTIEHEPSPDADTEGTDTD